MKPTIATIIANGILLLVFLSFIVMVVTNIIASLEPFIPEKPDDPVLGPMYDAFYTMYSYLKPIMTTKEGVAAVISIDLVLLGFSVYWRKEEFD